MSRPGPHAALVGATASGKSALALALASSNEAWEIVSVDSMQVYRGMDIGTAKPSAAEQASVPHHLIDVLDPWDDGTVAWFQRAARAVIDDIEARGQRALLVGGTGLYLQAVVDDLDIPGQFPGARAAIDDEPDTAALHQRLVELDPLAASRLDAGNRRRIVRALEVTVGSGRPFSSYGPGLDAHPDSGFTLVGIKRTPKELAGRIESRFAEQMAAGFLEEVRRLHAAPRGVSRTAAQALGYKELATHLAGEMTLDAAIEVAIARTRRFARRQRGWFGRDPRIRWFDGDNDRNHLAAAVAAAVG